MLIELATKFNKRESLKEPLSNYRYSSQFSNVDSLQVVLDKFIESAEKRVESYAKQITPEVFFNHPSQCNNPSPPIDLED